MERLGLGDAIGAFEIDPEMSERAAAQARYDLDPASLVNCVVVVDRREGEQRLAACLVPATKRVDVLSEFSEHWSPKVISRLNDYEIKVVKVQGEFVCTRTTTLTRCSLWSMVS